MIFSSLNDTFEFIKKLKDFFNSKNFIEVIVPGLVSSPGIDVHVHPLKVENSKYYLPTSPEFALKYLLSTMKKDIFNISYVFRDDPIDEWHRPQFIMLEWYRYNQPYQTIMKDTSDLLAFLGEKEVVYKTMQSLFLEFLNVDILEYLELKDLDNLIKTKFKDLYVKDLSWDDLFFLLFLNKIEPNLKKYRCLIIYEYPYHLAALSSIKKSDPRVAERLELYIDGIEIANCFNELNDFDLLKKRIEEDLSKKEILYKMRLEKPKVLMKAVETGIGNSSGIALGVERLAKVLCNYDPFWPIDYY